MRVDSALFESLWLRLWQKDEYQHPFYQPFTRVWFKEFEPRGKELEDLSFVVVKNSIPLVGVLIMAYVDDCGNRRLSCSGKPILCIEDKTIEYAQRQRAYKMLMEEFNIIIDKYSSASMIYWDYLYDNALSFLGKYFMERGAFATPYITQIVDLFDTKEELHRKLRKSYKSLINWGENNLIIRTLDANSITNEEIERYRQLHLSVAGKQTRSKKSWELQYEMIVNKEAFLVLGELNQELATGVFMCAGPKFCYYGISVSKRELFDKPMSHVLLWKAMLHAKKQGCKYFELGEQVYPRQANKVSYGSYEDISKIFAPTDKELNISKFKKGFSGQTMVRLDIRW